MRESETDRQERQTETDRTDRSDTQTDTQTDRQTERRDGQRNWRTGRNRQNKTDRVKFTIVYYSRRLFVNPTEV